MDSISKRCVIGNKVIDKFHNINIVFTSARFTLYDTEEKYEEFFENPNIIIKSSKEIIEVKHLTKKKIIYLLLIENIYIK